MPLPSTAKPIRDSTRIRPSGNPPRLPCTAVPGQEPANDPNDAALAARPSPAMSSSLCHARGHQSSNARANMCQL